MWYNKRRSAYDTPPARNLMRVQIFSLCSETQMHNYTKSPRIYGVSNLGFDRKVFVGLRFLLKESGVA